jgi:peroxiredoxin Q/BCP
MSKNLEPGMTLPDFELPDENGDLVRLSDKVEGGPVVLFFYPAAMSGGCTREACTFRDLGQDFADAGAQRLGISADPVHRQKEFSHEHSFDYPLLSDRDREVATAYGVKRRFVTPVRRATFVIDRDLTIRKVIASELDMQVHAHEALAALA